ncbi:MULTISPECIES: DUF982 domain-containing protein [Rhizobium]|uniref:DUF982 domain-containing protein n=1 Tax=Rhizobium indigoferae TaxID=158891 RepID=A0ABZ1DS91_9HYPH|nr:MULTISPECIES: DUF982 domain-containing protein [Rhizobium]WRW38303.1 DUF982 domain-containing protein [Rhizobium indigoferae]GLR56833.1 hypothetical protein GCM10007919_15570 [Rhizobium indigoferae]
MTQAYRLLLEWAAPGSDRAHTIALNTCKAALTGDIEAETARSVFAAFAERHDLLAPGTHCCCYFR